MRLVFAGTPPVAVPSLTALAAHHEIAAVITREDAPLGRKRVLTPSPVAVAAEELGLPVVKANRLGDEVTERVRALDADLGVIVAYGGLLREPLLSLPRLGWVNLHFSLLPRWRGAAPVQRSIIAGDTVSGAAVFQVVSELDAGDVFSELRRPIGAEETAGDLLTALSADGADLLAETVAAMAAGTATAAPQTGEPTFAPKLTIDDGRLDLSRPAHEVDSRFRGVTPEPGAWALAHGERFKVHAARIAEDEEPLEPGTVALRGGRVLAGTATAPIELLTVQPAGKRAMAAADWWRGAGGSAVLS